MKRLLLIVVILIGCKSENPFDKGEKIAKATLYYLDQIDESTYHKVNEVFGKALIYKSGNVITMEIEIWEMEPNGSMAAHIHEGTLELPGRHWNQGIFNAFCNELSIGTAWNKPFAGDVGNVILDEAGNGSLSISTDLWDVGSNDEKDIIELPVFIHQYPEDFSMECDPMHTHGHSHVNPKIGGGVITLILEN